MKTTLVIMAAGIGSRFGGGIKQLAPVGLNGEIIMDYSIHDAIEAGFNKIVFIIRKDIKDAFKEAIGDRIEKICNNLGMEIAYAYQELNELSEGVELPAGRTKPWGTNHAVMMGADVIKEPFAVINCDDFYGRDSFQVMGKFLAALPEGSKNVYSMVGFRIGNTLSESGSVARGVCATNEEDYLTGVVERTAIERIDGDIQFVDENGKKVVLEENTPVSMNMWGLTPDFLDVLENGFKEFFEKEVPSSPQKAEYLIPIFIGELLEQGKMSVKVLKTNDTWYGMTYHEDVAAVKDSFKKMLENGVYKAELFSDL